MSSERMQYYSNYIWNSMDRGFSNSPCDLLMQRLAKFPVWNREEEQAGEGYLYPQQVALFVFLHKLGLKG